jgi:CRP-like cAMP-binding protein
MKLFIRKLCHGARLHEHHKEVLMSLAQPAQQVQARGDIVAQGEEPRWLPLIKEGWACRYRLLENGKRQIISVYLPGDLCEPFGVMPRFMDSPIAAITRVSVAPIPLQSIRAAAREYEAIDEALWWDLLVASAIEREHIVGLGRRSAAERLGFLFCELHLRLSMVGLVDETGYELPLTQADLADLLGLTSVHVNRSLQDLRKSGVISLRGRRLEIHDLEVLREISMFDPTYLHPRDPSL